jgi:hypothetical protein
MEATPDRVARATLPTALQKSKNGSNGNGDVKAIRSWMRRSNAKWGWSDGNN